ncbi:substrate-binding periplasmic protein [Chitinimonas sp.]|uniref:substrate-binding periplasmic protein n=1 Tax=Chitinimonas sp. TaxID=1934313 RepID=UPI002F935076
MASLFRMMITLFALGVLAAPPAISRTVIIGAEDDWYPYSGVVNGQVQGLTIDLVRAAFEAAGLSVRYEVMPYARCMALVKAGALVGCFDTLRNAALEPDYLWHEQPMFHVQYQIYATAASSENGLRPRDLAGRQVAVTHGYEYGPEFDDDNRMLRVYTPRDENNFRMLIANRVQYTVAMAANTRALVQRHPEEFAGKFKIVGQVAPAGVYTVFSRRHPAAAGYMQRFDEGMAQIRKNGRYQAIEEEWTRRLGGRPITSP